MNVMNKCYEWMLWINVMNECCLFRIVLDESVIPQKYARVLVRALYVDSIDFDLVDDRSVEIGDR